MQRCPHGSAGALAPNTAGCCISAMRLHSQPDSIHATQNKPSSAASGLSLGSTTSSHNTNSLLI